jgi:hypothetical protein
VKESTTMEETEALAAAKANVDELKAAADRFQGYAEEVNADPKYSQDYKREAVAEARQQLTGYHQDVRQATLVALDRAHQLATQRLEAPVDAETEARKARAATRVGRLLDSGLSAVEAAAALAETGDVDALRALRDEVPSLVRVTIKDAADAPARKAATANTLLARTGPPLRSGSRSTTSGPGSTRPAATPTRWNGPAGHRPPRHSSGSPTPTHRRPPSRPGVASTSPAPPNRRRPDGRAGGYRLSCAASGHPHPASLSVRVGEGPPGRSRGHLVGTQPLTLTAFSAEG